MAQKILLLTPPFTQLNTPYPATAYLKGFFNEHNIESSHADLGIEVIHKIFCKQGLQSIFMLAKSNERPSENSKRMLQLSKYYIQTIDPVISFLENKNPTLARFICSENMLPQAARFDQVADLDWAFGTMGLQDKARHLCTLYLEDLSDFIVDNIDENFGFSRYAEHLAMSAKSFAPIEQSLQKPLTFIEKLLIECLNDHIQRYNPTVIGTSVPFPGNVLGAFRIAQYIKQYYPHIITVMGGGYPNTELRTISDALVFKYFDYITLDDGEADWFVLIDHLDNDTQKFKRTFRCKDGVVVYENNANQRDFKQSEVGTPDYTELPLTKYLSVIEMANPMHSLWSDGRWNKLTLAHGCYWGKCTFCDISLDYIKIYESTNAQQIVDRMELIIKQTHQTGFHFVDEAAPPAMMRELALEILRRDLNVTWWTNIRFEKSFTSDLCQLLAASGCVAVSGGLEVASDRLLELIKKGVTVQQVAKVAHNFTQNGIMVHAYLMYGFATQTIQETIDALENVRQLFEHGVIQSGFWHRFAMTAHSPVGMLPDVFRVKKITNTLNPFANNDIDFVDETNIDHAQFTFGLNKSLFNYMHGIGLEFPLQDWFDFKVPTPTIPKSFIQNAIEEQSDIKETPSAKVVWLNGHSVKVFYQEKKKKNRIFIEQGLHIITLRDEVTIEMPLNLAQWLSEILPQCTPALNSKPVTIKQLQDSYPSTGFAFSDFLHSPIYADLNQLGLLIL